MERVLIVDDSPVFRKVLKATLEKAGYEVITANDGRQAIEVLKQDDSPDLILLDRIMPDMDGVEVCRWARQHICRENSMDYKYFIILTAKTDQSDVLEGFAQGADDYVMKPFCSQELIARMAVGSRMLTVQRQLWHAAIHDALTGLYNRRVLYDMLAAELARALQSGGRVAVAVVDVDCFKKVNDTYGHAVGDEALVAIAGRLRSAMRGFDLAGRLGGEEFVVAFACNGDEDAQAAAERLRLAVATQPVACAGVELRLTVSIGVVVVSGQTEAATAIRQADIALYRAKDSGRNRVTFYDPVCDG